MNLDQKKLAQSMRPMTEFDLLPIMQIENEAYQFPWTQGIMSDCLNSDYYCYVYSIDNEIQGYIIFNVVLDELHLLNICIDPAIQNKGYGHLLLNWLIDFAHSKHIKTLYLEVRSSNHPAIHLYETSGFNEVGCRPNYYPAKKGKEDALLFAYELL
ncbi:MAG: ribosomal protein S18-alanine N-acetyltransferase [Gammaproteobacteria bacterium]|nr:ribosomal protein S18-alanine N-acetyltransferase [Gammaproteobacteria bacterium]